MSQEQPQRTVRDRPHWLLWVMSGTMTLLAVLIVLVLLPALTSKGRTTPLSSLIPESVAQLCANEVRPLIPAGAVFSSPNVREVGNHLIVEGTASDQGYSCDVTGRTAEDMTATASLLP